MLHMLLIILAEAAINRAGIHFQHAASLCSGFQCLVGSGGVARVGFIKNLPLPFTF